MANLVLALGSSTCAQSVVGLSKSPLYQYPYSSIGKSICGLAADSATRCDLQRDIQSMVLPYYESKSPLLGTNRCYLIVDTLPYIRSHSPTLAARRYVPIPNNPIKGNKPIGIGYKISSVNISEPDSKWTLPLSMERVPLDKTDAEYAVKQVSQVAQQVRRQRETDLVLVGGDSFYGNPAYLAPMYADANIVNIIRFRHARKVWTGADKNKHPKRVYGEQYYLRAQTEVKDYKKRNSEERHEVLQTSIYDLKADEHQLLERQTAQGRRITVELHRWNDLLIRSKDGHSMKAKAFDLIGVQYKDASTGKSLFERPLFAAICGQRKSEVSTKEAQQYYRHRYDIEPTNRFEKQNLLLDKYQSPDVQHVDNWLLVIILTIWLLFSASKEVPLKVEKWEQYLPKNKQAAEAQQKEGNPFRLSMAQTHKGAQALFSTFDLSDFAPKKSKGGKGRQLGETQTPRKKQPILRKKNKKHLSKNKNAPP